MQHQHCCHYFWGQQQLLRLLLHHPSGAVARVVPLTLFTVPAWLHDTPPNRSKPPCALAVSIRSTE